MTRLISLLFLAAFPIYGQGEAYFDEPNLKYEKKLYDIYINYNSTPTPVEQWEVIVGNRNTEIYQVQSHDTLWGISETMFSDGNFWPKIWSINSSISNPHTISPGQNLKFILGTESEPPSVTLSEDDNKSESSTETNEASNDKTKNEATTATNQNSSTESEDAKVIGPSQPLVAAQPKQQPQFDDVEIPPPEKISRPVIKKFPPSFPEWQNDNIKGIYDKLGISIDKNIDLKKITRFLLSNYIAEDKISPLGEIKEIETGGLSATDFQYLYIQVKKGTAQAGDKLLVVQEVGEVQSEQFNAVSIEVEGVVAITDLVSPNELSSTNDSYSIFRCMVLKAVNPLRVGSQLIHGDLEYINIQQRGPRNALMAQIIGGKDMEQPKTFFPQSIAYLDKGGAHGLKPGQILTIYANRKTRFENTLITKNIRPTGWLKIAKVTPHFSTAVILRASENINVGDYTGQRP